jgi:Protein of unknown function (DUF3237)
LTLVHLTHEGLSLWYGTPDAPAPLDEIVSRTEASLTVGVRPATPTNSVRVRFRVDGGFERSEAARELRTDHGRDAQYFSVRFPAFATGSVVEYCPVLSCAGRQVPEPAYTHFPSKFLLAPAAPRTASTSAQHTPAGLQRFSPDLEFLAAVSIKFDRPDFIGETPEGIRIDYYAIEGAVVGPKIKGKVLARSADHLFVRPDGIAVVQVRAVVQTDDGAMLEVEYKGSLELGEGGYERALNQQFLPTPSLVICPRILTGHPKYRWLNRVQCLAVGRVTLSELRLEYDVFAVQTRAHSPSARST